MRHARLVAKVPLTFPGPGGGFTMAHFPVKEVTRYGDTVPVMHAFLLDLGTANEGDYLAPDTMMTSSGYNTWEFPIDSSHTIHVALAPTKAHPEYRKLDSSYFGLLGYAFFQQFVSVFDFKNNTLSLYPLYSSVNVAIKDETSYQITYLDDAFLTYCHCHYPTVWLDAEAPPLKPGHVHLGLATTRSEIYEPALDDETKAMLASRAQPDTLTGRKPPVGLSLKHFLISGTDMAARDRRRYVEPLPAVFKDLSVPVMGCVGTDFLRTFSAMIIIPTESKVIFVK